MRRWSSQRVGLAAWVGMIACAWTQTQSEISGIELEAELQAVQLPCTAAMHCTTSAAEHVRAHWISRTRNGNLFLVLQNQCHVEEQCAAAFVERTARGSSTRLNIQGRFRVLHSGKSIPDVQTWRDLSESEVEYTRYTWTSGVYIKSESHVAYRVDGVECGSALECYQEAGRAQEDHRLGRALKILEQVHNVSFI